MAQLIVRNLPLELVQRLRARAGRALGDALLEMPDVGTHAGFERRRDRPRRVRL